MIKIIRPILFFLGVFACYGGAITQNLWLGPLVVALIIAFRLFQQKEALLQTIKLLFFIGIGSAILESLLIFSSIYTVNESTRWFIPAPLLPLWILSLWMNYAVMVPALISTFHGKHLKNIAFGAFFSIIIFFNAERRELLELEHGWLSHVIIAAAWGFFLVMIYQYAPRFFKQKES